MPKSKDKGVFDVSKPGKSAPSATSRPIITGHGPMLKDPMVSNKESEEKPAEVTPQVQTAAKVIVPVDSSDEDKPDKKVEAGESKAKEKPAEKKPDTKPEPPEEPEAPAEATDKPATTETESDTASPAEETQNIATDAVDRSIKDQAVGPSKEELARQEQVAGLIEAETYFLPIGQVTRRRNNRRAVVALALVLLLGAVGAYLAVDAGLVEIDSELPIDFINN